MPSELPRIYIHKMTVDDGGAPCVHEGVLSLAICKPFIRSTAKKDDTLLGFAGNDLCPGNPLVYIAKVTWKLAGQDYYGDAEYASRPDCIYFWNDHRYKRRPRSKFHPFPGDLEHDLGEFPAYKRAKVLLSEGKNNFRYFGSECPVGYKQEFPLLKTLIENLTEGHRVNFKPDLQIEIQSFIDRIWKARFP